MPTDTTSERRFNLPKGGLGRVHHDATRPEFCHLQIGDGKDKNIPCFTLEAEEDIKSKYSRNRLNIDYGNKMDPCLEICVDVGLDANGRLDCTKILTDLAENDHGFLRISVSFVPGVADSAPGHSGESFVDGKIQYWKGEHLVQGEAQTLEVPEKFFQDTVYRHLKYFQGSRQPNIDRSAISQGPRYNDAFITANAFKWNTSGPYFLNASHEIVQQILADKDREKKWSKETVRNLLFIRYLYESVVGKKQPVELTLFWAWSPHQNSGVPQQVEKYGKYRVAEFKRLGEGGYPALYPYFNDKGVLCIEDIPDTHEMVKKKILHSNFLNFHPTRLHFTSRQKYATYMTISAYRECHAVDKAVQLIMQSDVRLWIVDDIPTTHQLEQSGAHTSEGGRTPVQSKKVFRLFVRLDDSLARQMELLRVEDGTRVGIQFINEQQSIDQDAWWDGLMINIVQDGNTEEYDVDLCILIRRPLSETVSDSYSRLEDAMYANPEGLKARLIPQLNQSQVEKINKSFQNHQQIPPTTMEMIRLGNTEYNKPAPDSACFPIRSVRGGFKKDVDLNNFDQANWLKWQNLVSRFNSDPEWSLVEKQLDFLHLMTRQQPVNVLQGPPGTGKTRTEAAATIMTVVAGDITRQKTQVLVVAPTNEAVHNIHQHIIRMMPDGRDMVVLRDHVPTLDHDPRLFTDATRESFEEDTTGNGLEEAIRAIASCAQGTVQDADEVLTKLLLRDKHYDGYVGSTSEYTHALVRKHLAVFQDQDHSQTSKEDLELLADAELIRAVGEKYVSGISITKAELRHWFAAYKIFRARAILEADIIVTTCVNATNPDLVENFKPRSLFVDDAAHAPEPDIAVVENSFPSLTQINLCGDDLQLAPISYASDNELRDQQEISRFRRMKLNHIDIHKLDTQFRMTETLCAIPNMLAYGESLRTHGSVKDKRSGQALAFRTFIEDAVVPMASTSPASTTTVKEYAMVNIPDGVGYSSPSGTSKTNFHEISLIINLVEELIQSGACPQLADIAIISPYMEQVRQFKLKLKEKAVELNGDESWLQSCRSNGIEGDISTIKCLTVDSMQGSEAPFIFFSFTATGNDYERNAETPEEWSLQTDRTLSRFMRDPRRLNVALTRQRSGLVVVGNFTALEATMNSKANARVNCKALRNAINFFRESNHFFTLPGSLFDGCDDEYWA